MLGVDPEVDRGGELTLVTAANVVIASLFGGALAAAAHWVVSKRLGKPQWWPFIGSTAIALSMLGPSYYADGSSAVALIAMHLAVGAVLVWGLAQQDQRSCFQAETVTPRLSRE